MPTRVPRPCGPVTVPAAGGRPRAGATMADSLDGLHRPRLPIGDGSPLSYRRRSDQLYHPRRSITTSAAPVWLYTVNAPVGLRVASTRLETV